MDMIPETRRVTAIMMISIAALLVVTLVGSLAVRARSEDGAERGAPPPAPRMGTLDNPLTAEEMRGHFAGEMAQRGGSSVDEARADLEAQGASAETSALLETTLTDRLAGVWVEHEPEFHIVAWYTGGDDGLEEVEAIAADSPVPVEIRTGAPHTLAELVAISDEMGTQFTADDGVAGRWIEVQTGAIHILLLEGSPLEADIPDLTDRLVDEFGVPVVIHRGEGRSGDD